MVANALSTNVSIILMKVSMPAEEGSIIPIMGISHHPHVMGFSNHPPSRLFNNKFLHVSINNKIISINREEAYTVPNSSIKATINKIRPSTRKEDGH
jgi:hypothetical protein